MRGSIKKFFAAMSIAGSVAMHFSAAAKASTVLFDDLNFPSTFTHLYDPPI